MAGTLLSGLLSLRRNPRLHKLPPYLSFFLIIIGLVWLLVLPLNEYSRRTYISENALLPGQVHTYFGGSEHNVFRAYRQEVAALAAINEAERTQGLVSILQSHGLKVASQDYHYSRGGQWRNGTNVYGIIQGPRADATEAMVLIGPWINMRDKVNYSGVALVLTLARYFKRWSLWSKDIIVLITPDSTSGPSAWVDAYHEAHDTEAVDPLSIKSGALQGAVAIDYDAGPWGQRFDKLHIMYDGINGQLPNLDLINSAINIASQQIGIGCTIQSMWDHQDTYEERLVTILRSMMSQAVGHSSGAHSSFIPYHVDAITLQTYGDGWHDEMSLGRATEGLFRSLNNLLEHLHQSFFFYLLMQSNRFVSIGTYLPSAMLIAGNFTITAILLWFLSGRPATKSSSASSASSSSPPSSSTAASEKPMTLVRSPSGTAAALVPSVELDIAQRELLLPALAVLSFHTLGLVPFYLLNTLAPDRLQNAGRLLGALSLFVPVLVGLGAGATGVLNRQHLLLVQCLSLLVLGAALSTLATINFAQALGLGLAAAPLSFVRPLCGGGGGGGGKDGWTRATRAQLTALMVLGLCVVTPFTALLVASHYYKVSVKDLLLAAAWGWRVEGVWVGVSVWLVWWPAWASAVFALVAGVFVG